MEPFVIYLTEELDHSNSKIWPLLHMGMTMRAKVEVNKNHFITTNCFFFLTPQFLSAPGYLLLVWDKTFQPD